jgi:hypothetical protein
MIGKIIIIVATIFNISIYSNAYSNMPIKMSLQNDIKNRSGKRSVIVDEIVTNSKYCTKKSISIDTMILNIYQVNKVFFNSQSSIFSFSLKNKLDNMYYINEHGNSEKLTNNTIIYPNILKNIFVYELDVDRDIDCIVYKQ